MQCKVDTFLNFSLLRSGVSQSSKVVEHTDNLGTASAHEMRDQKLRTYEQTSHDKLGSLQSQPVDLTHAVLNILNIAHCSSGGSINEFQQCSSAKIIQKDSRCFQINSTEHLLPLPEHAQFKCWSCCSRTNLS